MHACAIILNRAGPRVGCATTMAKLGDISKAWLDFFFETKEDGQLHPKQYFYHAIITLQKVPTPNIRPAPDRIMRMFRLMNPGEIRVIMMSQDPYPSVCEKTGEHIAYGVAFYTNPITHTTPATLKAIVKELMRCYPEASLIEDYNLMLCKWMSQGVFLTNRSLTTASNCDDHLADHSVVWEWLSREFLRYMSRLNPNVIFVLLGSKAWELETSIPSTSVCIKAPHPVSRSGEFVGCDMFIKVNKSIKSNRIEWA